ncbi:hypothetical protein RI578_22665 [Streptomyces sp. BB1-1-1]|uniref:hypothetical protein n=1 Tax=Streptomyces sp. BB1-1-1 TaxID=3074430 RepID=UPI00287800FB|nr:hypothetical protein [Streptomyces sp. BB1-1-1]WND36913.1 hypothetical protein RI578_22665 [Streptomyces sp. BB1-1-1]
MLPEGIPTVTVTGRYLFPDGRPLSGQIVWRAPALITFADYDVILGGPVTVPLDEQGRFTVELPATDAPGMNPAGWSYSVAEQFAGVAQNRVYQILLPAESPEVDIADLAPTDPTTPNYVAVRGDSAYEVAVDEGFVGTVEQWLASLVGPQGATGATGAPGSQVYTGSTAPPAELGVDGDVFTQYTTTTALGVTSTTVNLWARSGGAWAPVGGDVRGAAWYVNNTGTPSADIPLGDLLLRVDSGDVYQRAAAGWELQGNIRGPQGEQGPQGDTGPAGAPGVVQSVNGQSVAAVVLDAADVGAVPDTAPGTPNGVATLDGTGKVPAEQLPAAGGAVTSVNTQTGDVVLDAADVGAVPTTQRGAANGVATLDASSKVPSVQLPAYGFRPSDLGFKAWAFDPATAQSGGRTPSSGSFRITAVPVRETITVSKLVWHVLGYEGTGLDGGSNAGIFTTAGARLAQVGDMADTSKMIDVHNAGGQTVAVNLSAAVTLNPGIYYVCFRFVIGTSANAPVLMCADSSNAAPVTTLNSVKPFGVISSQGSWPSSFSPSAIETDPIKFWAAFA